MIKSNFIYITFIILILSFWGIGAFIIKSKKTSKKTKNITGWAMFGGLWPLLNKDANRTLSKREIIGFLIAFIIVVGAFAYTYFGTGGTFIW
ncbi:MAG: hypothetical protein GY705_27625 [Bacteroidetes bacterium]|nr:hypothetical protein [Bacteroidota bacterium]